VWEPFLMVYNNQLVVYYSDQRDSAYGQKIVHQVSSDLKNWGSVVNDVTNPTYSDRPGMPTVSKMNNGQYFLTYENGGAPEGELSSHLTMCLADKQVALLSTSRSLRTLFNSAPSLVKL